MQRAEYSARVVGVLEGELRAKKELEGALLAEKQALEKQLIGYLSLFNKLSFEEAKASRPDHDHPPIDELLNSLSRLEASFHELHSSKRDILSKLMSDSLEDEISSVKRHQH